MSKIDKIMGKYIRECDCAGQAGCDCNAVYDLDYPVDVQGMIEKGWSVDRRYPTGTTIGDQTCGTSEYLVRFTKDGVIRWRKFQADRMG